MTRMTAHSPSLWTRRLSISKVRPTFSVYSWFLLFSLLASAAFLDTLVCIHRLSLSFAHSPPLRDLDWSTQIPGNACMDTMSRMLHTGASLLWILFKLWSELLLISGDEHESGKNLTATQRASQAIFLSPPWLSWLWLRRKIASCVPLQTSFESLTLLLLLVALCKCLLTTGLTPNFSLVSSTPPACSSVFIWQGSGQSGVQQTPSYSLLLTGF